LLVLVHPSGKQGRSESLIYLVWERFEDRRPKRADHDARIDVLVRSPTVAEVIGSNMWVGGLECLDYSNKEAHRFRVIRLGVKVAEPLDQIYPIERFPISVLMVPAVENHL
jgi:hypothetical protein